MEFTADDEYVTATYAGGGVRFGQVLARRTTDDALDMHYHAGSASGAIRAGHGRATFAADPLRPVADPYPSPGAHDYASLAARADVLTFETAPFAAPLTVAGEAKAVIRAACDCRDFDLWVRLQDVHPDGRAFNLTGAGNDVVRASYREAGAVPSPLEPGRAYELSIPTLLTAVRLGRGHRIRVQDVVIWYDRMKMTPDQIIAEFPSITLADVHAALAYYYDHRDAIERQMAEGEAFAAEMMAKAPPSIFQERLRQLRANAADDPVSSG